MTELTPLLTDPIERTPGVTLEDYPSGFAVGAAFREALSLNPSGALGGYYPEDVYDPASPLYNIPRYRQAREDLRAQGRMIGQDEANRRFGIPGELSFDTPEVPAAVAQEQHDITAARLQRRSELERARGGIVAGGVRLAASFAASALDPINIASAFIPVVGEARYASWAARQGRTIARLERGVLEGAVGAAAVEPLVLARAEAENADYTAMDSLLNIAFGGALGGGLHVGAGWLRDRLMRSAFAKASAGRAATISETIDRAPAAAREAALRGAVAAVVEGRPVRVTEALPELDPAVAEFDRLRQGFGGQDRPRRVDDLTAPSGLLAAPAAKAFDLGAATGEGAAARHADYTPVSAGDRPWLEGIAAEVTGAQPGYRLFVYNEAAPGQTVTGEKGTFPRWFTDMNRSGDKVTGEIVERTARKLLAREPLGVHEGRVARAMMAEARGRREENVGQMVRARQERAAAQLEEIRRQAAAETPWELPEDRQAAAEITERTQPTLRAAPETAEAQDAAALEQQMKELEAQLDEEGRAALAKATAAAEKEAPPLDPKAYETAAACLAGVV